MSEIKFLGKTLTGITLEGFFAQQTKGGHRGFFPIVGLMYSGDLNLPEVSELQAAGISYIPVDCTEAETKELVAQAPSDKSGERFAAIVRKAVTGARKRA